MNVPGDNFAHQAFGRVFNSKLSGHQMVRVQSVDGEFYKNGPGCSRLGNSQRLSDNRRDFSDRSDGGTELTQRLKQRHLVNVLQCSSALEPKTTNTRKKHWLEHFRNINYTHYILSEHNNLTAPEEVSQQPLR